MLSFIWLSAVPDLPIQPVPGEGQALETLSEEKQVVRPVLRSLHLGKTGFP